jgi:hypothetical protein
MTPATVIGDHTATYALTGVGLWRRRRSVPDTGWQDVTGTAFGTWTPDVAPSTGSGGGEVVGSRLQLMTRSPFAFTRSGSRRWLDGFLAANPDWPCLPQPPLEPVCLTWNDQAVEAVMPALWEQDGAVLSTDAQLVVVPAGPGRALRLGPTSAAQTLPRRLWVTVPEPASEVTALVDASVGCPVLLKGWAAGTTIDDDVQLSGVGLLRVTGDGLDAVTLDWRQGLGGEPELAALCWVPVSASTARASWEDRADSLATAAQRWSDVQQLLEPDCHYLLAVTTRANLRTTNDGVVVQDVETTHTVQFCTAGPPAIPPDWLARATVPATAFPFGGALADLSGHVLRTVPDPGASPVFTGYDLACTFVTGSVPQLYGGDLTLRVFGDNGQPVRDASGADLVLDLVWQEETSTTLSGPDAAWVELLRACTGRPLPADIRGDDTVRAGLTRGVTLPPSRALTAQVEATRPLFTDPFTDLAAFDQQVLRTAAAVTTCSATGRNSHDRPATPPARPGGCAGRRPRHGRLHGGVHRDGPRRRQLRPGRRARRAGPVAGAGADGRWRPATGPGVRRGKPRGGGLDVGVRGADCRTGAVAGRRDGADRRLVRVGPQLHPGRGDRLD